MINFCARLLNLLIGALGEREGIHVESQSGVQGYLTLKKTHPPRTLPQAYA